MSESLRKASGGSASRPSSAASTKSKNEGPSRTNATNGSSRKVSSDMSNNDNYKSKEGGAEVGSYPGRPGSGSSSVVTSLTRESKVESITHDMETKARNRLRPCCPKCTDDSYALVDCHHPSNSITCCNKCKRCFCCLCLLEFELSDSASIAEHLKLHTGGHQVIKDPAVICVHNWVHIRCQLHNLFNNEMWSTDEIQVILNRLRSDLMGLGMWPHPFEKKTADWIDEVSAVYSKEQISRANLEIMLLGEFKYRQLNNSQVIRTIETALKKFNIMPRPSFDVINTSGYKESNSNRSLNSSTFANVLTKDLVNSKARVDSSFFPYSPLTLGYRGQLILQPSLKELDGRKSDNSVVLPNSFTFVSNSQERNYYVLLFDSPVNNEPSDGEARWATSKMLFPNPKHVLFVKREADLIYQDVKDQSSFVKCGLSSCDKYFALEHGVTVCRDPKHRCCIDHYVEVNKDSKRIIYGTPEIQNQVNNYTRKHDNPCVYTRSALISQKLRVKCADRGRLIEDLSRCYVVQCEVCDGNSLTNRTKFMSVEDFDVELMKFGSLFDSAVPIPAKSNDENESDVVAVPESQITGKKYIDSTYKYDCKDIDKTKSSDESLVKEKAIKADLSDPKSAGSDRAPPDHRSSFHATKTSGSSAAGSGFTKKEFKSDSTHLINNRGRLSMISLDNLDNNKGDSFFEDFFGQTFICIGSNKTHYLLYFDKPVNKVPSDDEVAFAHFYMSHPDPRHIVRLRRENVESEKFPLNLKLIDDDTVLKCSWDGCPRYYPKKFGVLLSKYLQCSCCYDHMFPLENQQLKFDQTQLDSWETKITNRLKNSLSPDSIRLRALNLYRRLQDINESPLFTADSLFDGICKFGISCREISYVTIDEDLVYERFLAYQDSVRLWADQLPGVPLQSNDIHSDVKGVNDHYQSSSSGKVSSENLKSNPEIRQTSNIAHDITGPIAVAARNTSKKIFNTEGYVYLKGSLTTDFRGQLIQISADNLDNDKGESFINESFSKEFVCIGLNRTHVLLYFENPINSSPSEDEISYANYYMTHPDPRHIVHVKRGQDFDFSILLDQLYEMSTKYDKSKYDPLNSSDSCIFKCRWKGCPKYFPMKYCLLTCRESKFTCCFDHIFPLKDNILFNGLILKDYEKQIIRDNPQLERRQDWEEVVRIRALNAKKRILDGDVRNGVDVDRIIRDVSWCGISCMNCGRCKIDELQLSERLAVYQAVLNTSSEQLSVSSSCANSGKLGGGQLNVYDRFNNISSARNACLLMEDVTLQVTYPELNQSKSVKLSRGYACTDIMNALVSVVDSQEQGCKAFVKSGNSFHKELLLDQPYYNTMHDYYLRNSSPSQDFPLKDHDIRDFFPSTPYDKINQVSPMLSQLYKTIHQLENGDEIVFFTSQTPTLQPAMTVNAVKAQYRFNADMVKALDIVMEDYSGYRTIRGDGNCYFRAFMVGFIEDLIQKRDFRALFLVSGKLREVLNSKEIDRVKAFSDSSRQLDAFLENLLSFVVKLDNTIDYFAGICDAKELNAWRTDTEFELDVMQSQSVDIALVWSSRLIVSDYLVRNKDKMNNNGLSIEQMFQACFELSTEEYCARSILSWGTDAESPFIELGVLEETFGCDCNIVMLDRSGAVKSIRYQISDAIKTNSTVALFLKPGHYDLLCQLEKSRRKILSPNVQNEVQSICKLPNLQGKNALMQIREFICKTERDDDITLERFKSYCTLNNYSTRL